MWSLTIGVAVTILLFFLAGMICGGALVAALLTHGIIRQGKAIEMTEKLRSQGNRFLIAIDSEGYHIRETLFVIHRLECHEVHYQTAPILSANRFCDAIEQWVSHKSIKKL